MLFASWTPADVQAVVNSIGNVLLTLSGIVVAVLAFLNNRKSARIEIKTDEQTKKIDDIQQSVAPESKGGR
jgi:uncharacterized protein YllA (UPF0747 family)